MKRNALKWSAGLIAGFATLLASCGTDYKIDTVLQLDKADVTAVAYPGVNMISWEPIASAQTYTVYVYEEDVYKGKLGDFPSSAVSGFSAYDTDIVNDKEYTYYVVANSGSDPSVNPKAVVVENSMGSDSVTAIVPPIGTKALDLVAYEDGYDGEVLTPDTEEDEYILTAGRVKTAVNDSGLFVSFPAKAYLNYDFKLYDKALDHVFYTKNSTSAGTVSVNSNNVVAQQTLGILGGGKYQLALVVSAKGNAAYDKTEVVIGDVEIAKLNVEVNSVSASYLVDRDMRNATARVIIKADKNENGTAIPATWFKAYRYVDGEYDTTAVGANIVYDRYSNSYYFDDTVPDVNVKYTYLVTMTDGVAYSNYETGSLNVKSPYADTPSVRGVSNENGKIVWAISNTTLPRTALKAYVIVKDEGRSVDDYLATEIISRGKDVTDRISVVDEKDPLSGSGVKFTITTENLVSSVGEYTAIMLVVASDSGKLDNVVIEPYGFKVTKL